MEFRVFITYMVCQIKNLKNKLVVQKHFFLISAVLERWAYLEAKNKLVKGLTCGWANLQNFAVFVNWGPGLIETFVHVTNVWKEGFK